MAPALSRNDITYCRRVCQRASHTFYRAANRLPKRERDAAFAVYAFCRVTDDLIDTNTDNPTLQKRLFNEWKTQLTTAQKTETSPHPVLRAFATIQTHYQIPQTAIDALFEGVESDIPNTRRPTRRTFRTFRQLRRYCYQVAGTVGLMLLPVLGVKNRAAAPAAINLGIAMQLTNILRDIDEDHQHNRTYLPTEDFARFGLNDTILAQRHWRRDPRAQALLEFETTRARAYYERAIDGLAKLSPQYRVGILAAFTSYRGLLALVKTGATPSTREAFLGRNETRATHPARSAL